MGSPHAPSDQIASWPDGIDALIVPGLPGRGSDPEAEEHAVYPSCAIDIVKLLREQGIAVDYAPVEKPRAELALKAAELWVPLIIFARDVLLDGGAHALVEVIWDRLRGRSHGKSILHLSVGRQDESSGTVDWFESHGHANDVLHAFTLWADPTHDHE